MLPEGISLPPLLPHCVEVLWCFAGERAAFCSRGSVDLASWLLRWLVGVAASATGHGEVCPLRLLRRSTGVSSSVGAGSGRWCVGGARLRVSGVALVLSPAAAVAGHLFPGAQVWCGARGDAVTTEVPVSLWSFLSSRFVSVMVCFALFLLWNAWRWCSDVPAAAVGRFGCMYRSSWCLECCGASPAMDPLLLRWSLQTLDRSLPVRKITRSPQGHGSFGCEAAAAAAARLRLVSAVVSVVCWSKDLSVISFTVEVFCTAGESSI